MDKQLIELLLGNDVILQQLLDKLSNIHGHVINEEVKTEVQVVMQVLLTIRVMFAEYFHQRLTDEAKAYFEGHYVNPKELVAILPKFRNKSVEIVETMKAWPHPEFYVSFLEGKISYKLEEGSETDGTA